jgi:hypothetical protein
MKAVAILGFLVLNLAAADLKTSTMTVRVVPEVLVSVRGTESVSVRIRLSDSARARMWIGDNCSIPPADSHTIGKSGEYEIPIEVLPGSGRMVCLLSEVDGLMELAPLFVPRVADPVLCINSTCSKI